MSNDFTKNPPQIEGIIDSTPPVTHGTILKYGLADLSIAGILIDSYSRSVKYAAMDEIVGQAGRVEGIRMSDVRAEISVSGRVISTATAVLSAGSILAINGDNALITEVSMSAGSKDFVKVDIKATSYEGVTGANNLLPNMSGGSGT
jgi:hypothetical protein